MRAVHKRIYSIQDQTAQLTFRVIDEKGIEKKTVFRLYWKNYFGEEQLNSKTLLVTDFPPNDKGIKFLVWDYTDEQKVDQWLYLPELRQVRKIVPGRHDHSQKKEEESDLLFEDMRRRPADRDDHLLLGEEEAQGELCYVIESRPRGKSPYGKRRVFISKSQGTIRRIDYFGEAGELVKTQWIDWQQIGRGLVWKRSQVTNVRVPRKTFIELSEVRINVGLTDDQFSERALRQ